MPFKGWQTAKHPGFKSEKDQARGGTRSEVAKATVLGKVTRNKKSKNLTQTGEGLRKEAAGVEKARKARLGREKAKAARDSAREAEQEQTRVNLKANNKARAAQAKIDAKARKDAAAARRAAKKKRR